MNSNNIILDSSALLAMLKQETGHEKVKSIMKFAIMTSINLAECYYVLRKTMEQNIVKEVLNIVKTIVSIDKNLSEEAAELYSNTRAYGLSIADCVCLALANQRKLTVYTADKQWVNIQKLICAEIICIR